MRALDEDSLDFYPRSHVGNDPHHGVEESDMGWNFYPRSHVGNDNISLESKLCNRWFLSTFPRRERLLKMSRLMNSELIFLSTFPRRERRVYSFFPRANFTYFYPRSHVGNDTMPTWRTRTARNFYPRSHVGNDGHPRRLWQWGGKISIHVPT